jgi:hypothetical protein
VAVKRAKPEPDGIITARLAGLLCRCLVRGWCVLGGVGLNRR